MSIDNQGFLSENAMLPTILLNNCCWLRKRPSISATKLSGRSKSWSACSKALAACCA